MKTRLLVALLLFPLFVCAQHVSVRGVVRAQSDGAALAGVTVLEKGTTNGTSTDTQGRFALVTTRRAPRLVVSSIGYLMKEVHLSPKEDSVTVLLQEDTKSLSEVVVTGHFSPRHRKSASYSASAVSGRVSGVMIRGVSSVSTTSRTDRKAGRTDKEAAAGVLTAGEINDFGKWTLWPGIAQQDLSEWNRHWGISPLERYTAQLVTEDGFPVVGATVRLQDPRGAAIWEAQSDNTGKCELWNGLFASAEAKTVASLQTVVNGKTYTVSNPTVFRDGINIVRVQQPCRAPAVVDIAFVVDATGSMGDEIQYLQAELGDVIASVKDSLASSTVRLGSVFYRDAGDEYVTRTSDFSATIRQTTDFIRRQRADGGGDFPEAVDEALAVALKDLSWTPQAKARLLFLILDAPPHENPEVLASLQRSIRLAAAKGIRIIPITASGIDKSTEYLMRSMALATNGTYVFLTDDSGVGDAHIKPTTDQFDVELLNTLLVKLIAKYAHVADCQNSTASTASKPDILSGQYQPGADSTSAAANNSRPGKGRAWKCYPVPTSDVLHVELEGAVKELFVTDATGKVLLRATPDQNKASIRVGSFPTGVYFLTFYTGKTWEKARFLVSR